jgi:hypothetical protein
MRQVHSRRCVDARGRAQFGQEAVIALARVAPHDAAQGGIRFQCRRINADRLPFDQSRVRKSLQEPREDRFMRLDIDQSARPR